MKAEEPVHKIFDSIPGLVRYERMTRDLLEEASQREFEKGKDPKNIISFYNQGIKDALEMDHIYIILKNRSFRLPDRPTFFLVEQVKSVDEQFEHTTIDGAPYRIIGEEYLAHLNKPEPKKLLLGVIRYEKEKRESNKNPVLILLPSLPFRELELYKESLGIDTIQSVSPSFETDLFIREELGFEVSPDLATLIISFNDIKG